MPKIILRLVIALALITLGAVPVRAQMSMSGGGRSLGGYGASTIGSYYGGGGGGYIPYMGNGSGFMPYRSGQGGGMGVQPSRRQLPQTSIGGRTMAETPIGGASLSPIGERARGGMAMTSGSPRGLGIPFGYEGGIGTGGMGTASFAQRRAMRPGPGPGFGYPFRMPAPLPGSSAMTMP
jgi:hypothetical protein